MDLLADEEDDEVDRANARVEEPEAHASVDGTAKAATVKQYSSRFILFLFFNKSIEM